LTDMTSADRVAKGSDWSPVEDGEHGARVGGLRGAERAGEYQRLHEECPVAHSTDLGGYYTFTKYADVVQAALNHRAIRSGRPFVPMPDFSGQIPITLNPPEHTPYRRALNRYFKPDAMARLEPILREQVSTLLGPILERRSGEMMAEFSFPLPALALAALMNMPQSASDEFMEHMRTLDAINWDPAKVNEMIFGMFASTVSRIIEERRGNELDPEVDLISGAMLLEIDGRRLTDDEVVQIGVQVVAAGHQTTAEALGAAIYRLATNPATQARLRRHPELIPSAVEEFLRVETPLHELARDVSEDVEIGGCPIPKGARVALNFGAANLDEEQFEHADACIIDRSPNKHLAFGHGVHKCVGAPMARLELVIALEELLARTRSFDLAGPTSTSTSTFLAGFKTVPVQFHVA